MWKRDLQSVKITLKYVKYVDKILSKFLQDKSGPGKSQILIY